MSAFVVVRPEDPAADACGACEHCLRHSWLLGELCGPLDLCARNRARFIDALRLEPSELLAALGGRRREELERRLAELGGEQLRPDDDVVALCRHDQRFPRALRDSNGPRLLYVSDAARLHALLEAPVVAILGGGEASDYGAEMAAGMARGLGAAGVSVASTLAGGVPAAAQAALLELNAVGIAVHADGPRAPLPARVRSLHAHLLHSGCVLCELPGALRGRRFGAIAAERTLAALADAVVLVEARAPSAELAAAHEARANGRIVAAVPGRATSPLASGPLALLRERAELVRRPQDVLELLGGAAAEDPASAVSARAPLAPRLRSLLERVAAGSDTAERLCARAEDPDDVLLGLSELELMGLLGRGAAGRYLPRASP